jgi:rod shape-determining protein MreB
VAARSVRVGGDELDSYIIQYIKKKYNLLIGERTAEDIKIGIGSAYPFEGEASMDIQGRDLMDGLPKNISVTSEEVGRRWRIRCPLFWTPSARRLEKTPPELSADIIDHGITLTGGGRSAARLDQLVSNETGMPVHIAENPLDALRWEPQGAGRY